MVDECHDGPLSDADRLAAWLAHRSTRREILRTGLSGAAALALLGAARPSTSLGAVEAQPTLNLVGYVGWIGKNEYANFKRATGITVKQVVANSSEDRLVKIQADPRSADIILADLGFAGRLQGLGLLAKLDYKKIPNFRYVDKAFKVSLASPTQALMSPTDYGRSGILYRTDMVTENIRTWKDFFRLAPKYSGKVSMLDFADGTLPIALIGAGYKATSKNPAQIHAAANLLIKTKPHVLAFITSDEAKPVLDGSAAMAQVEDFAASAAVLANPKLPLKWVDPLDGIHGYLEGWVVSKASRYVDEAQEFFNYHLSPKVAANFVNTLGVASIEPASNRYVLPKIKKNPIAFPSAAVARRIEYAVFLGQAQKYRDQEWARFKAA